MECARNQSNYKILNQSIDWFIDCLLLKTEKSIIVQRKVLNDLCWRYVLNRHMWNDDASQDDLFSKGYTPTIIMNDKRFQVVQSLIWAFEIYAYENILLQYSSSYRRYFNIYSFVRVMQ